MGLGKEGAATKWLPVCKGGAHVPVILIVSVGSQAETGKKIKENDTRQEKRLSKIPLIQNSRIIYMKNSPIRKQTQTNEK